MKFLTLDMELADRILPSICSITIISWINDTPAECFHSLLNPECDVEDFFKERHGMTNEELQQMPFLREKWIRIYDILEEKMVFAHNANVVFQALKKRADIDLLNMPDFTFAATSSIARRCFHGLGDYRLPNVAEKLNITNQYDNSYIDAHTVGRILLKAIEHENVADFNALFRKVGYVGGKFKNNEKILYHPIRDKKTEIYVAKPYSRKTIIAEEMEDIEE